MIILIQYEDCISRLVHLIEFHGIFLISFFSFSAALVDLGGLSLVLSCLESPNLDIRSSAARILSTASPHNTEFQTKVPNDDFLAHSLHFLTMSNFLMIVSVFTFVACTYGQAMQCCNIVEVLVTRLETERVPQSLNPLLATLTC